MCIVSHYVAACFIVAHLYFLVSCSVQTIHLKGDSLLTQGSILKNALTHISIYKSIYLSVFISV